MWCLIGMFFLFKQKTAYEMRISDWSSDVCSSDLLYTLTPKSSFSADLPKVDWQLAIDQPTSPVALATSRIAVARGPHTIDYYAGAQWIDDAPYMVQRLMIESFENSPRTVGVGRQSVSLRSDFVLRVELRGFPAPY